MARVKLSYERKTRREALVLHPMHLRDVSEGVRCALRARLMQWQPELGGVPVAFEQVRLCTNVAALHEDMSVAHAQVDVTWRIFRPEVGALLTGEINTVSMDHLGLHVGPFNASIARQRLPPEYVYREDADAYVYNGVEDLRLCVGSSVTFCVEGVETLHGALTVVGNMSVPGTGLVPEVAPPVAAIEDAEDSSADVGPDAGNDADTEARDSDGDAPDVQPVGLENRAEEAAQRKKAKKAKRSAEAASAEGKKKKKKKDKTATE